MCRKKKKGHVKNAFVMIYAVRKENAKKEDHAAIRRRMQLVCKLTKSTGPRKPKRLVAETPLFVPHQGILWCEERVGSSGARCRMGDGEKKKREGKAQVGYWARGRCFVKVVDSCLGCRTEVHLTSSKFLEIDDPVFQRS